MDIFDTISYAKGSVICRMLHSYLGETAFTECLRRYLTVFGGANAKTDDLLAIMDQEFGASILRARFTAQSEHVSVSAFIKPWIQQKCFPMVMVQEDEEETGKFELFQSCVYMSEAENTRGMLWPIHVTYVTSKGKKGEFVFTGREFELEIEIEEGEAVWFNHEMKGFYLPVPSGPYFQDTLLPQLSSFSDAD